MKKIFNNIKEKLSSDLFWTVVLLLWGVFLLVILFFTANDNDALSNVFLSVGAVLCIMQSFVLGAMNTLERNLRRTIVVYSEDAKQYALSRDIIIVEALLGKKEGD